VGRNRLWSPAPHFWPPPQLLGPWLTQLAPASLQHGSHMCWAQGNPSTQLSRIPALRGEGETGIWINLSALASRVKAAPFASHSRTSVMPPPLPAPAMSPGCDLARTLPRRGNRDLQDTRHDRLFLSFLTLGVRRTSEHCRHERTSFVGHTSV